jgi:hypothetical protein
VSQTENRKLIGRLSRSQIYRDYENAFNQATGLPLKLRVTETWHLVHPLADESSDYVFSATVSANVSPTDFTARVIPQCNGVAIPLEDSRILWQH